MKKIFLLLFVLSLAIAFAACSNEPQVDAYEQYEQIEDVEVDNEILESANEPDTYTNEYTPEEPMVEFQEPTGSNILGALHRVEYGNNVAYLFGTIHGGHPHWFPLADIVEDALRRADIIAVEVDELGDLDGFEDVMLATTFLPNGLTWAEYLPETEYTHLVNMMDAWGLAYDDINTMNPSLLVHTLVLTTAMNLADFDATIEASVDAYITSVAAELGLPVIGLESSTQQVDILFNPPFDVMLAHIMTLLPPDELVTYLMYESYELTLDELAYLYENNDFDAINDSFATTLGAHIDDLYVTYMREIVSNWRSTYYANEIMRLLQVTDEPTTFFVAVGLSHINRSGAGEEFTDIVQQLKLAGFEPIPLWE